MLGQEGLFPAVRSILQLVRLLNIFYYRVDQCKETLKQLCEIASEADDLRAQALYSCCQFDALLELGKYVYMSLIQVKSKLCICCSTLYRAIAHAPNIYRD